MRRQASGVQNERKEAGRALQAGQAGERSACLTAAGAPSGSPLSVYSKPPDCSKASMSKATTHESATMGSGSAAYCNREGGGGGEAQGCQPPIERVCGEQRAGGEVHRARVGWRGRQQGVQGSASVLKSSFFVSTRTPSALDLGWIIAGAPGGGWVLGGEGA